MKKSKKSAGSPKAGLSLLFGIVSLWNGLGAALFAALIPIFRFAILKMREMPSGYAASYLLSYAVWSFIAAAIALVTGAAALVLRKKHIKENKKDTKLSAAGRILGIVSMGLSGAAVVTALVLNIV